MGGMRRVILASIAGLLILAVVQVGIYNWRLALAMRHKHLTDELRELEWKVDELLVDRVDLVTPDRLEDLGGALGLGPLPLDRFRVLDLDQRLNGGAAIAFVER